MFQDSPSSTVLHRSVWLCKKSVSQKKGRTKEARKYSPPYTPFPPKRFGASNELIRPAPAAEWRKAERSSLPLVRAIETHSIRAGREMGPVKMCLSFFAFFLCETVFPVAEKERPK